MTWQSFKQAWLIRFWSPVPAVIAAGILSTYYFGITGTFWAVTGEFTRWGGQLLQLLGMESPRELMRQKEDLYKSLNLADPALSNAALIQAMVDNPKLIERPIVVSRGQARIGRPPEQVLEIVS